MIKKKTKTIGVLGGMGAAASAYFYMQLVKAAQQMGAKEDEEFPQIIINSLPLYGLRAAGINAGNQKAIEQLKEGVRILEQSGSDFIVIACNTVHQFLPDMQASVTVPILSMIEETVRIVSTMHCSCVGVLATDTMLQSRLYEKALGREGIRSIVPEAKEQKEVIRLIDKVTRGSYGVDDYTSLKNIVGTLNRRGADGVILGCTELSILDSKGEVSMPCFNSSDILAKSAVSLSMKYLS